MTTSKQEKLLLQSTHYMHIKTDKVPPFIMAGSIVFLEKIPLDDIQLVGSDIYVIAYENGAKQFLAGRREKHMLWFVDIRTGTGVKMAGEGSKALFKVKMVKPDDIEIPTKIELLRDQIS
ncbi:hypothetical protein [Chitinophaga sp. 212800010-3]|uniref:hypothetical protein n=1 Tax=unclassified Chitinophaga TaxID=2619133 RepID=UPI002DEB8182|nr:PH domain-containing protein [Chitinophaga sp. 212800010-3]